LHSNWPEISIPAQKLILTQKPPLVIRIIIVCANGRFNMLAVADGAGIIPLFLDSDSLCLEKPGYRWFQIAFSNASENYGGCRGFERLLKLYSPVRLPLQLYYFTF